MEHIVEDIEEEAWFNACLDMLLDEIGLFLGKRNDFARYLREREVGRQGIEPRPTG